MLDENSHNTNIQHEISKFEPMDNLGVWRFLKFGSN